MRTIGPGILVNASRVASDTVAAVTLVASTEQHFPAPAGATLAYFEYTVLTNPVYVLTNGQTAAAPVANVAASVFTPSSPNIVPEISPTVLSVTPGTNISLFSTGTPTVVIAFYRDALGDIGDPGPT